jgi:predicted permease
MSLLGRIANLFSRSRIDREIETEFRSHIDLRIEDNLAAGMSPAEARRDALVRFGNRTATKEQVASADVALTLESVAFDLRYAFRQLRRSPGFTLTAVFTLALAIGANAVVFSVMNAFVLRPLNVPQAQTLYAIFHAENANASYPDYLDLRDRNRSFDGLAAFNIDAASLDTGNNPTPTWLYETSGNYFDALRLQPYLGHFFHASDERGPNSAPYIVLSYAYWHSHFQDDRSVLGRVVQVNKHPFTILGVAPPGFNGTLLFFNPSFFVPIVNEPQIGSWDLNARGVRWVFMTMGHLKAGITASQAAADLNSIALYLERTYPKDDGKTSFTLGRPGLYGDFLGRPVQAFLTGLMLLAGLILLAACANLGSLFAARAADRSREVALRLALGSSRKRILRALFSEAALISLAGGAAGLFGSVLLLRQLSAWQPFSVYPIHLAVNPDTSVYAVALLLTLVSGFLFGAVPVRQVLRTNPYEVVKSGSSGRVGRRVNAREILLGVQIAICAVLVTSSLVAVRGLARSLHGDFGFALQNTMLADTDLSMAGYRGGQVPIMQKRMIDAVRTIPGVESVGLSNGVPLGTGSPDSSVFLDKTSDLRPSNAVTYAYLFNISPEYLHAAGTQLLSGRTFTWHDDEKSPRVAIVNQEFARKVFGSEGNAIGGYYKLSDGARIQVVGIVEEGKYASLTEDPQAAMFFPILQSPSSQTYLVVHVNRDPQQVTAAMRSRLRDLDAGLPVHIQTRDRELDFILFGPRMATVSLGVLGVMGAILSITGIFGMASYSVSKRVRELGIRIALGAQRTEVLQAALGRAARLLAYGSAAGLLLGIFASRVLAFLVYQATPRDPLVLGGVVLTMLLLGLVAAWIPAQRALSLDPLVLLREE